MDDSMSKRNKEKRNKKISKVSGRVAPIIATKKRQGMCLSLPTPENPFNDSHGNLDTRRKETKKLLYSLADGRVSINGNSVPRRKGTLGRNHVKMEHQEQEMVNIKNLENEQILSDLSLGEVDQKITIKPAKGKIEQIRKSGFVHAQQGHDIENLGCPSKFLISCLNSIKNALWHDRIFSGEEDRPLFVDKWGYEFWKCYSVGKDILVTSGACSTAEQIAWMTSTAADSIASLEKDGLSFNSPFLLFLVPSKEKATKVRSVCKPLKALGIHTASLHPDSSLDHQIQVLKSCEPEFLISTPKRLLELVSLKAIDISGVYLLVVDDLETFIKCGYIDIILSIRQAISANSQTIVFYDCLNNVSVPLVRNLLRGSICRLSLNDSIASQSACIIQSVHVCVPDEKISKSIQILDQACGNKLGTEFFKVLFVAGKDSNFHMLITSIISKGYSISTNSIWSNSEVQNSKFRSPVSVVKVEHISSTDLEEFEVVIIYDFELSIDNYIKILTRMARRTVNGMLYSILTREDAPLAGPLIEILEQCGQAVSEPLRNLCYSSSSSSSSLLEH